MSLPAVKKKPLLKRHQVGRPTKYDRKYVERAERLASLGYSDSGIATELYVDDHTIIRWKQAHEPFRTAILKGRERAVTDVEVSLKERAMGYSHRAVHFSSHLGVVTATPYTERYPPDTAAAKLYLTNRAPERWKDAQVSTPPATVNIQVNFDAVRERLRQRGALVDVTPTPG